MHGLPSPAVFTIRAFVGILLGGFGVVSLGMRVLTPPHCEVTFLTHIQFNYVDANY